MNPFYALFSSFIVAWLSVLVISFWAKSLSSGLSCAGIVITWLIAFAVTYLLLLFASAAFLTTAAVIFGGIVVLTLIVLWISGS